MRSSIAVAVAVAALGCNAPVAPPIDASNAAACDCHLEGSGLAAILVMSWSCYCASAYGDGCTRELASACTDFRQRFDYPGCGLTDLRGVPAIVPSDDVFDQDGKLVGTSIASDTTPYKCPSDPSLTAARLQAGRLPEASCAEVACGTCTTAPFPCSPATDGGAGQ